MKIAIGSDHRGFDQKNIILNYYNSYPGVDLIDVGTKSEDRTDYPIFAHKVVTLMEKGQADLGILLCGSGVGMAIAANRHKLIYAGVAWNKEVARVGREHDNINLLVLPSDFISDDEVISIIAAWMKASFFGGRYQERLDLIEKQY